MLIYYCVSKHVMENVTTESRSAGGIVLNKNGEVLVVSQKGRSWSLPKGHIEEGETELEAAIREIGEEAGVFQLELISELGSYQRYKIALDGGDDFSDLKTMHMFLFKTDQMELHPIDENNPEARWVKKEEVVDLLTHYKDKDFFLSVLDRF